MLDPSSIHLAFWGFYIPLILHQNYISTPRVSLWNIQMEFLDGIWVQNGCQMDKVSMAEGGSREKQKIVGIKMENEWQFSGNYVPCVGKKTTWVELRWKMNCLLHQCMQIEWNIEGIPQNIRHTDGWCHKKLSFKNHVLFFKKQVDF